MIYTHVLTEASGVFAAPSIFGPADPIERLAETA
jgi:hypothetical protein